MIKLKLQSTRKREKGIALLFTLIMLSLLLILALSFALDSMFAQKAAYNSASTSSATFLGQAQLKQVLLLMKQGEANFDSDGRLYSHDFHNTVSYDMLKERLPYYGILDSGDSCLKGTTPNVNWSYIRKINADSTSQIIGRTAFVVIPDDRIPLDSLVDSGHNETVTEYRIGKDVSEINVRDAIPAVTNNLTTILKTLNWNTFTGGMYTGGWGSFSNLFTTLNTALSPSSLSDADKKEFEDKLIVEVSKDQEAFWADLNDDKKINADNPSAADYELFNRFDLTRTDWNTADNAEDLVFLRKKLLLDAANTGKPAQKMEVWDANDSDTDSVGLPWLACFGYKADGTLYTGTDLDAVRGTFDNVYDRRCQIAANLKDYCDNDDNDDNVHRPTSDVDPATWRTSSAPKFTGNEKTPYINKLGVDIKTEIKKTGSGPYNFYATIDIVPYAELINIYKNSWGADLYVDIEMEVNFIADVESANVIIPPKTFTLTVDVGNSTWVQGYSNFAPVTSYVADESRFDTTSKPVSSDTATMTVKVASITIKKAVLYSTAIGTMSYDYVKTLTSTFATQTMISGTSGDEKHFWAGWAVHDPRQNLNAGDWKELTPKVTDFPSDIFSLATTLPSYEGQANCIGPQPTEDPKTGADKEQSSDPANKKLSTAHFRNAPMESPWELGFIHRGAKWETLNLKTYDYTKAFQVKNMDGGTYKYIAGGGLYNSGDANILDQIKMTAKAEGPQKINISSRNENVLKALFSRIRYACDIDDTDMNVSSMARGDTTKIDLTPSDIESISSALIDKYKDPSSTDEKRTRASAVDKLLLSETSTPAIASGTITDAIQEELIGKIVNLTKLNNQNGNSNSFSIIILAQAIRDIGGVTITKSSLDGTVSASQACTIGTFDAATSNSDPNKHIYFDEITGEQKIIVKCSINGSTVKIESFQYID